MKYSWRIGKIYGIDIYVDSSWIVIFILFSWVLAGSYFPQKYPDWARLTYWVIGVFTSLLVFASVLVHELTHSFVAIKQGEKVRSITLFIFGGVAQISEEPNEPSKEFVMAFAGPFSSLALAGMFFSLAFVFRGVNEYIHAATFYLFIINTFLAFFNLLPGFPMDGGRVLRAILWKITGNLRKATRIASSSGQVFAFLLMFLGLLQILNGIISGLWLIFIGWFLHSAAVRGYQQVVVQTMLKGVRAADLMTKNFKTVTSNGFVQELVDNYILREKERVFLVSDGEKLMGIVCLEDVKATPREKWSTTRIKEIMTPREKLEAVSLDTDGNEILNSLTTKDIHQVPVMEGDEIFGVICRSDILKFIKLRTELGV